MSYPQQVIDTVDKSTFCVLPNVKNARQGMLLASTTEHFNKRRLCRDENCSSDSCTFFHLREGCQHYSHLCRHSTAFVFQPKEDPTLSDPSTDLQLSSSSSSSSSDSDSSSEWEDTAFANAFANAELKPYTNTSASNGSPPHTRTYTPSYTPSTRRVYGNDDYRRDTSYQRNVYSSSSQNWRHGYGMRYHHQYATSALAG